MRFTFILSILLLQAPSALADVDSLRITEEAWGLVQSPGSHLLVGVKGDTAKSKQFIAHIWKTYKDAFPPNQRVNYGPDSGFTQIEIIYNGERIVVGSWHTAEQDNPKIVVTSHGIEALDGRDRKEVLAVQPEAYRRFRAAFDAIVDEASRFKNEAQQGAAANP